MSRTYVLTTYNDDSILAGKIILATIPDSTHLSSGRTGLAGEHGDTCIFIRPYGSVDLFIDPQGYGNRFNITIFDYESSNLYEHKDALEKCVCTCIWIKAEDTMCEAVWRHYRGNKDYPEVVLLTRDYMKWELQYADSIPFHYGMSIVNGKFTSPATDFYIKLINGDAAIINQTIQAGLEIERYLKPIYDELGKELIFESTILQHSIICANISGVSSRFFGELIAHENYDFSMIFNMSVVNGKVRHTIYQINPEVSAKLLARAFGGGGHSGSSSFTSTRLEIESSRCDVGPIDYNVILGSNDVLDCVAEYIRQHHCVSGYGELKCTYEGRNAILSNTPFLTRIPMFANIRNTTTELGVTFCLCANHMYRIAVCSLDGQDPGEEFGDLFGQYRISTSHELTFLGTCSISKEAFWPTVEE